MSKVCSAIQRIDIPAIVTAPVVEPLLFAKHVMRRKLFADALANQRLRRAVCCSHQIGLALVFDLQLLVKIFQQE